MMKIRFLRYPYLIIRAILLPFEKYHSSRHRLRLKEYDKFSVSFEEGISSLTNVDEDKVNFLMNELNGTSFLKHVENCIQETRGIGGSLHTSLANFIYVLIRIMHPQVVVETGVANGVSSAFILKALDENSKGKLYSIDLDYREGVSVPIEKELGWIIPDDLRARWELVLGESTKVLPNLFNKFENIDIFLHDSRHLYKTMMNEYNLAWPHLKKKGLLLSDDVNLNDAFLDFADKVNEKPLLFGRIGTLIKNI